MKSTHRSSRWLRRRVTLAEERGVTMLVVLGTMVITLLTLAALLTYTSNDTATVRRNVDQKQAYYAAQAAVNIFEFRLQQNINYWSSCPWVTTPTAVPGNSQNEYYEFSGIQASSGACSASTMVDSSGTFRIAFTGMECTSPTCTTTGPNPTQTESSTIVVTFKREGFLNFVYFTVYETIDPTADPAEPSAATGSNSCYQSYAQRPNTCDTIEFGSSDVVDGPLHSNDQVLGCGSPTFGRSGDNDVFEDNGTPFCPGNGAFNPTYNGSTNFNAATENMPPNNTALSAYAAQGTITAVYNGPTDITLASGAAGWYTVENANINGGTPTPEAPPSNGVIYVNQSGNCSDNYTPFGSVYDDPAEVGQPWYDATDSGCGDAYVSGPYDHALTIGAADDIVIDGNLTTNTSTSSTALLGLIANNFVRVYRPLNDRYADTWDASASRGRGQYDSTTSSSTSYLPYSDQTCGNTNTDADPSFDSSTAGPTIDAAILAITGSFIVDNFDCGPNERGQLNVTGAIAQVFRGPVGLSNGIGYGKNYVYDNRLGIGESPPHFLNPADAGWEAARESVCYPTSLTNGCS